MSRSAIMLVIILICVIALFRFCNSKPEKTEPKRQAPLAMAQNTGPFNLSFEKLLTSYYALKDAFVDADTIKVNAASLKLIQTSDSLRINDIQGDSSGAIRETARSFAATITSSANAITGEKDIEGKRKELNMITDALWSLTRTVKYNGQKVYYQFCPMAFNNAGAYWLSAGSEIRNPYFGAKMLTCGETQDSVDYSKR